MDLNSGKVFKKYLNNMNYTKEQIALINLAVRSKVMIDIRETNDKYRTRTDIYGSKRMFNGEIVVTIEAAVIYIYVGEDRLKVPTVRGYVKQSIERILVHELGHAVSGFSDKSFGHQDDSMYIVNKYENPIMNKVDGLWRTGYWGK